MRGGRGPGAGGGESPSLLSPHPIPCPRLLLTSSSPPPPNFRSPFGVRARVRPHRIPSTGAEGWAPSGRSGPLPGRASPRLARPCARRACLRLCAAWIFRAGTAVVFAARFLVVWRFQCVIGWWGSQRGPDHHMQFKASFCADCCILIQLWVNDRATEPPFVSIGAFLRRYRPATPQAREPAGRVRTRC